MVDKTPEWKKRTRKAQTFDKDNIFIEMKGQKINIYQMIQEAREDTEIYPTLEKYGCIEKLGIDPKKVYSEMKELSDITDLRQIYQAKEKADKMWEKLPIEVREQFNNNAHEFMQNGEKWLKDEIAKQTKPVEQTAEQPAEQPKGE